MGFYLNKKLNKINMKAFTFMCFFAFFLLVVTSGRPNRLGGKPAGQWKPKPAGNKPVGAWKPKPNGAWNPKQTLNGNLNHMVISQKVKNLNGKNPNGKNPNGKNPNGKNLNGKNPHG